MDMATRMDGKAVSAKVKEQVAQEVAALQGQGVCPGLAVVIVGEDPASRIYVNNKKKACQATGIHSEEYALPASTTQEELLALVDTLNHKEDIHGILVQSPLPKGLDEGAVVEAIDPQKDVDAFHAYNVGKIMMGDYHFLPCTPAGIMELLQAYDIPVEGKRCVVIGRSNIVGKPMAMLLLHQNGTVTICHSRTKDLPEVTRQADILVSAAGALGSLTRDCVRPGQIVLDVSVNWDPKKPNAKGGLGAMAGDVVFEEVEPIVAAITPVPGGVGAVTTSVLMGHVIRAATLTQGGAPL